MQSNSPVNNIDFYNYLRTSIKGVDEIYSKEKFLALLKEKSLVTISFVSEHENYGSPNRGHSIWIGSAFPPDTRQKPKTKGFAENVASLKKFNDYNHALWIDRDDFTVLDVHEQNATKEYCMQNNIALVYIQDVFPNKDDDTEVGLYNIYLLEHSEGNFAAACDAMRLLILRRFYGLYCDVDNKIIAPFSNNHFSNQNVQFHNTDLGISNDLISLPYDAQSQIDQIAAVSIEAHTKPLNVLFKEYDYLMVPYHTVRFDRTVGGAGPAALKNIVSEKHSLTASRDDTMSPFTIDVKSFECAMAHTWLENDGTRLYSKDAKQKLLYPEYEFPLSKAHPKATLKQLIYYYFYLEDRALRFDFFRKQIDQFRIQGDDLEKSIFQDILEENSDLKNIEYIPFNSIHTFISHFDSLSDKEKFPNLKIELYLPEIVFMIKQGRISENNLYEWAKRNGEKGPYGREVILYIVEGISKGKSILDLITGNKSNPMFTPGVLEKLAQQLANKGPQLIFLRGHFEHIVQDYIEGKSDGRDKICNFFNSDDFCYMLHLAQCNHYDTTKLFVAKNTALLNKIIENNDIELLHALSKYNIYFPIEDDIKKVLGFVNQHHTDAALVGYFQKLLALTPKYIKSVEEIYFSDLAQFILSSNHVIWADDLVQDTLLILLERASLLNDVKTFDKLMSVLIDNDSTKVLGEATKRLAQHAYDHWPYERRNALVTTLIRQKGLNEKAVAQLFDFIIEQGKEADFELIFEHIATSKRGISEHLMSIYKKSLLANNMAFLPALLNQVKSLTTLRRTQSRIEQTHREEQIRYILQLMEIALLQNKTNAVLALLTANFELFNPLNIKFKDIKKIKADGFSWLNQILFLTKESFDVTNDMHKQQFSNILSKATAAIKSKNYTEDQIALVYLLALLHVIKAPYYPTIRAIATGLRETTSTLNEKQKALIRDAIEIKEKVLDLDSLWKPTSTQKDERNSLNAKIASDQLFLKAIDDPESAFNVMPTNTLPTQLKQRRAL